MRRELRAGTASVRLCLLRSRGPRKFVRISRKYSNLGAGSADNHRVKVVEHLQRMIWAVSSPRSEAVGLRPISEAELRQWWTKADHATMTRPRDISDPDRAWLLVQEGAALARRVTGWPIPLESLTLRLQEKPERGEAPYPHYIPQEETMTLPRASLRDEAVARLSAMHESIHRGQAQQYPRYHQLENEALARWCRNAFKAPRAPSTLEARDTYRAYRSWIEGQPTLIEKMLRLPGQPDTSAKNLGLVGTQVWRTIARNEWLPKDVEVVRQASYRLGHAAWKRVLAHEPSLVERIWENPPLAMALLRAHGTVTVYLDPVMPPAERQQLRSDAETALRLNPVKYGDQVRLRFVEGPAPLSRGVSSVKDLFEEDASLTPERSL